MTGLQPITMQMVLSAVAWAALAGFLVGGIYAIAGRNPSAPQIVQTITPNPLVVTRTVQVTPRTPFRGPVPAVPATKPHRWPRATNPPTKVAQTGTQQPSVTTSSLTSLPTTTPAVPTSSLPTSQEPSPSSSTVIGTP